MTIRQNDNGELLSAIKHVFLLSWAQTEQKRINKSNVLIKYSMRPDVALVMRSNWCLTAFHTLMFSSANGIACEKSNETLDSCPSRLCCQNIP